MFGERRQSGPCYYDKFSYICSEILLRNHTGTAHSTLHAAPGRAKMALVIRGAKHFSSWSPCQASVRMDLPLLTYPTPRVTPCGPEACPDGRLPKQR
ncbi:hypothetical protein J2803_005121 [Paraburkholderia phenoliruptrix]|nr:hypothetical protein [Paraburkholderia phenoliruptrix]